MNRLCGVLLPCLIDCTAAADDDQGSPGASAGSTRLGFLPSHADVQRLEHFTAIGDVPLERVRNGREGIDRIRMNTFEHLLDTWSQCTSSRISAAGVPTENFGQGSGALSQMLG